MLMKINSEHTNHINHGNAPFEMIFGANEYSAIKVERGRRVRFVGEKYKSGWTHATNIGPSGPDGFGGPVGVSVRGWDVFVRADLPVGALVASFVAPAKPVSDPEDNLNLQQWKRIFKGAGEHAAFLVGGSPVHYVPPANGFVYFIMNDAFVYPGPDNASDNGFGYGDNDGSVLVSVRF